MSCLILLAICTSRCEGVFLAPEAATLLYKSRESRINNESKYPTFTMLPKSFARKIEVVISSGQGNDAGGIVGAAVDAHCVKKKIDSGRICFYDCESSKECSGGVKTVNRNSQVDFECAGAFQRGSMAAMQIRVGLQKKWILGFLLCFGAALRSLFSKQETQDLTIKVLIMKVVVTLLWLLGSGFAFSWLWECGVVRCVLFSLNFSGKCDVEIGWLYRILIGSSVFAILLSVLSEWKNYIGLNRIGIFNLNVAQIKLNQKVNWCVVSFGVWLVYSSVGYETCLTVKDAHVSDLPPHVSNAPVFLVGALEFREEFMPEVQPAMLRGRCCNSNAEEGTEERCRLPETMSFGESLVLLGKSVLKLILKFLKPHIMLLVKCSCYYNFIGCLLLLMIIAAPLVVACSLTQCKVKKPIYAAPPGPMEAMLVMAIGGFIFMSFLFANLIRKALSIDHSLETQITDVASEQYGEGVIKAGYYLIFLLGKLAMMFRIVAIALVWNTLGNMAGFFIDQEALLIIFSLVYGVILGLLGIDFQPKNPGQEGAMVAALIFENVLKCLGSMLIVSVYTASGRGTEVDQKPKFVSGGLGGIYWWFAKVFGATESGNPGWAFTAFTGVVPGFAKLALLGVHVVMDLVQAFANILQMEIAKKVSTFRCFPASNPSLPGLSNIAQSVDQIFYNEIVWPAVQSAEQVSPLYCRGLFAGCAVTELGQEQRQSIIRIISAVRRVDGPVLAKIGHCDTYF